MCRRSLANSSMQGIKPELRLPECVHAGEVCGRCSRSWAERGVLERQEAWCSSAVSSSSAASACGDRCAHFCGETGLCRVPQRSLRYSGHLTFLSVFTCR